MGKSRGCLALRQPHVFRHCERSEAIQNLSAEGLWIASSQGLLAMTAGRLRKRPLRPQIEIALPLELGQTDHAAFLRADEARQEIRERDVLRLHRVAAGGELDPIL